MSVKQNLYQIFKIGSQFIVENNCDIIINECFELIISKFLREKYNYYRFVISDILKEKTMIIFDLD